MRVFITGVAGFVGAHLARRLVNEGVEVIGIDVVPHSSASRLQGIKLDYRWQSCQDLVHVDADYVVHFASIADVPLATRSPIFTLQQNVLGTAMLLEACARDDGFQRIVIQSSESVYGHAKRVPIPEDEPLNPSNIYGASKAAQEMVAMSYHHSHKLPVTILRSSTLYWAGARPNQAIPIFITKALNGEPIPVEGEGKQSRDFNALPDLADAILLALTNQKAVGQAFNIASGTEVTILELAQKVLALNGGGDIVFRPGRPGEGAVRLAPDISKARLLLGYTPKISFDEGLRTTYESYRTGV
jgi:nucleoside-diphosphate-sugar epimerase